MSSGRKLNVTSFMILTRAEPTMPELQRALDAQNLLGRMTLFGDGPIEVPSESPPEHLWRGWLEDRDVAFRIGNVPPSQLPGAAKDHPDVQAWPLAMWTTNSTETNNADSIAAGAMALLAWAAATGGVAYYHDRGAVADLGPRRRITDFILASCLNRGAEFEARYPDVPLDRGPKPGEKVEIRVRVL